MVSTINIAEFEEVADLTLSKLTAVWNQFSRLQSLLMPMQDLKFNPKTRCASLCLPYT